MITKDSEVLLKGVITDTGTGTFKVAINEFFVDAEWKTFNEPREMEINSDDYTSQFTSVELAYIKKKALDDVKKTTLCPEELAVVKSIASKLKDNP